VQHVPHIELRICCTVKYRNYVDILFDHMSDSSAPARKRGRPRDPERVERVLAAAGQLFQTQGFDQTSLDEVAQRAGVSKMTVYSYFPNKQALFEAAIARGSERAFFADALVLDPQQPRAVLTALGKGLMSLVRHPQVSRMMAMLFAMGPEHQAVREGFYRQGPERMLGVVRNYLSAAQAAGTLHVADAAIAADQFCALCASTGQYRVWLNLPPPTAAEDAALLEAHIALFLRAHAPLGPDPGMDRR
jgi:TetR/AcrR family transcriptional repressor of mexJK operon